MWARMQFERWANDASEAGKEVEKGDEENNCEVGGATEEDLKSPQKKESSSESVTQKITKEEIRSC